MKYDYLIIGAGLFGSIFAHEANKIGKKVLVIDKRNHIGGNCYTENFEDYHVHKYGAHIFHTSQKYIWNYINQFSEFRYYSHRVKSFVDDKFYSMPINLITINQLWPEIRTPEQAKEKIKSEIIYIPNPSNLEEQAISQVGITLYEKFIKGYTKKHWGKDPKQLPSQIIKRLPIRYNMNERYYHDSDIYEGLPQNGYTSIFKNMLNGIDVELNVDFFDNRSYFEKIAHKIVYSGPIDKLFNYEFGKLEYRSLKFDNKIFDYDYQGHSVVNYPSENFDFTRIIQHKYFNTSKSNVDYVTFEYSDKYDGNNEAYYPINDHKNKKIYELYKHKSQNLPNVIIGGRLGNYQYYDMDMSIGNALSTVNKELAGN